MVFFMTVAMYCFACAWHDRSAAWAGFFLAVTGASALVKGPVTVLVLGGTAALLLLFYGRWRPFLSRPALLGGVVGLGFVGLWPAALFLKGEFSRWFSFFIIGENFGKFADALQYPTGTFLSYLLQWCLPWTFLLLAALVWLFLYRRFTKFEFGLPLVWGGVIIGIHLLPDTKLAWYMFLLVPACMLVIAGASMQAKLSRSWRYGRLLTQGLFALLGLLLAVLAWFLLPDPLSAFCLAAAALFCGFVCWALWKGRLVLATVACVLMFFSLISAATRFSPPHFPSAEVVAAARRYEEITRKI